MANKIKNYKYGAEEETDTKKKKLLLFKARDQKGQRNYYHYTEEGNFKITFIIRIKFSLRKHLLNFEAEKDRNVLRFTNILFINRQDPSLRSE